MSNADLITKLNSGCVFQYVGDGSDNREVDTLSTYEVMRAAADRIEALAAEVERLTKERDEFAAILASPLADKVVEYGDRAESAERALAEAVEIMRPFLNVRDQFPESAKLILKKVSDLATINLTVTKGQFRAARDFITAHEKEKGK